MEKQAEHPNLNRGRWTKGQSGNPSGRPRSNVSITSLIKEMLAEIDDETGKTNAELIAEKLITMGRAGDAKALLAILDRVDGKVTTPIDLNQTGENGFVIEFAPGLTGK